MTRNLRDMVGERADCRLFTLQFQEDLLHRGQSVRGEVGMDVEIYFAHGPAFLWIHLRTFLRKNTTFSEQTSKMFFVFRLAPVSISALLEFPFFSIIRANLSLFIQYIYIPPSPRRYSPGPCFSIHYYKSPRAFFRMACFLIKATDRDTCLQWDWDIWENRVCSRLLLF